ncbi:hypothetical protein MUP38_08500, partial [Candidatus Bathyarchaeota archaeon]|nr:hypothetical protein [Candidatus Bathyarchaeota archaeon]
MPSDLCRMFVDDFLKNSGETVKTLAEALKAFKAENRKPVSLLRFKDTTRINEAFDGNHFFLRGSVEYTNPQLTVEEVQGIIGTRMLAVCGSYFHDYNLNKPDANDVAQICEAFKKPPDGRIIPCLLNTD